MKIIFKPERGMINLIKISSDDLEFIERVRAFTKDGIKGFIKDESVVANGTQLIIHFIDEKGAIFCAESIKKIGQGIDDQTVMTHSCQLFDLPV